MQKKSIAKGSAMHKYEVTICRQGAWGASYFYIPVQAENEDIAADIALDSPTLPECRYCEDSWGAYEEYEVHDVILAK